MSVLKNEFDSIGFGLAVKSARKSEKLTRNQIAEELNITTRYLMSIENSGQHPSLNIFYALARRFHISIDQYFYPNVAPNKTSIRRQVENLLDKLSDHDLIVMESTANGIIRAKGEAAE